MEYHVVIFSFSLSLPLSGSPLLLPIFAHSVLLTFAYIDCSAWPITKSVSLNSFTSQSTHTPTF